MEGIAITEVAAGTVDCDVGQVRDDSRAVEPGDLFVAVPGKKVDGRQFVLAAIEKGAAVVIAEGERRVAFPDVVVQAATRAGTTILLVGSARVALGLLASRRFGAAGRLCLTGVTGTNGKTTTTHLIEAILGAAGRRAGILGTVGYGFSAAMVEAPLTTPGAVVLHELLRDLETQGATDVVMEASSMALSQDRLLGCAFRVGALTNITQDHLDDHGTMQRYLEAKTLLFTERLDPVHGVGVFLTNREEGRLMSAHARRRVTVSSDARGADVVTVAADLRADGITATLDTPMGRIEIRSPLVGDFNLENLLVAVGVAVAHGIGADAIVQGLANQKGVPGRLQRVDNDEGVLCVVDYAHTPDALQRALQVLRPLTVGRLFVVFGCGGDRDKTKRPLMGHVASLLSDVVVVTSDNPRTEDPAGIVSMVVAGVHEGGMAVSPGEFKVPHTGGGAFAVLDRRTAIEAVVAAAQAGDTVLLAGKGHEDYQIVGTTKFHFDDREVAAAAFGRRRDQHLSRKGPRS